MGTATSTDTMTVRLFAEQVLGRRTGVLTVVQGKLKRLFCLERGDLIFAASNLIEEQLDEFLVRKRFLSPAERASAKLEAWREGKKVGLYLQDNAIVKPAVLERASEDHARELLHSSLAADGGVASFDRGRPKLDDELTVKMSCVPLVLEHVRHHPKSVDQVRVQIGPPDTKPSANPAGRKLIDEAGLDDAGTYLVEACDGSRDVAALVEASPAPAEETLRALNGLLLLGVLVPGETEDEETDSGGVTRDEALARLALAQGADHYMVLGVDSTTGVKGIRSAYYMLARRFHPDRFRSGDLQDLLLRFEGYFTQVTGAYNTLSDPELREQYDEERNQKKAREEETPEHDTAYLARQNFLRAKALLAKRQLQAAVTFLENAIELDGNNATYHQELGLVLTGNPRRRSDAERYLVRAVELDPTVAAAHVGLGRLYKKLDRKDDAIRCFREALQWEPADDEAKSALRELGVKTR